MRSGSNTDLTTRRGGAAVRALYTECGQQVFDYVRRRVKSPADVADIVQDVFVIANEPGAWERFSGETTPGAYLLGIARNRLLHFYRARRIRDRVALENADDLIEPVETDAIAETEFSDLIGGLLSELNQRDSEFFRSHMMERPARRITAERFGITEDQVRYLEKKLRARTLQYLKRVGYLGELQPGCPSRTLAVGAA